MLVSGPIEQVQNKDVDAFLAMPFDFPLIKTKVKKFAAIYGDNDPRVPVMHAEILSRELAGELVLVKNGGHLNGSSGWNELPQCLEALNKMMLK